MSGIPYWPNMSPYKAAGMLMKAAKAHGRGTHDRSGGPRGGRSVGKASGGGGKASGRSGGARGGKK